MVSKNESYRQAKQRGDIPADVSYAQWLIEKPEGRYIGVDGSISAPTEVSKQPTKPTKVKILGYPATTVITTTLVVIFVAYGGYLIYKHYKQ